MFLTEAVRRTVGRVAAPICILTAGFFSTAAMAALAELNNVTKVPQEVVFKREIKGTFLIPETNRYERYAGGSLERMDFKNPEYAAGNGPMHARDHTLGARPDGTMWMIFKLRTEKYFESGVANHIPILLRGQLSRSVGAAGGSQSGRGLSLFSPANGGLTVENFGPKTYALANVDDGKLQLRDGVSYWFVIHASVEGIAYSVYDESGENLVEGYWRDKNAAAGGGYGFAVLCDSSENGSCDFAWDSPHYAKSFEVRFSDIAIGWF